MSKILSFEEWKEKYLSSDSEKNLIKIMTELHGNDSESIRVIRQEYESYVNSFENKTV
jgi:hypothetical protein